MSESEPSGEPAARPPMDAGPLGSLVDLVASITPVDEGAAAAHRDHQRSLTKPEGALGRLEGVAARLAAIAGTTVPPAPVPAAVVVCAGDHGVHAEGVSPWPQSVTADMVANICAGGAAINAIARTGGLDVVVVNAGVATAVADHPGLRNTPIRHATGNIAEGPALTVGEATAAVLLGADVAGDLIAGGARCLVLGEMGIANTTPAAAVIAAVTGAPADAVTGRGTGIDDATLAHKVDVVTRALRRAEPSLPSGGGAPGGVEAGVGLLAELGGSELCALAGVALAGASARIPVIVDGVITVAAALAACRMSPAAVGYLVAGHRSVEPGATHGLDHLGLEPLLDLDLRLGEGTGGALAHHLVVAAVAAATEMATFDQAAVAGRDTLE